MREPYGDLTGLPKEEFGTPEYKEIVKLRESQWRQTRDADAQTPWLTAPAGKTGLIAFDDPQSARLKGRWARANDFRGIFLWAIGHDFLPSGKHELVEAAIEGWETDSTGGSP